MGPYASFHDKQALPSVITHARLVYTSRAIPANILLALEKDSAQTLRIIHFWNRRLWRKVYKRPKRNKKPKLKFRVYSSQLIKAYWMMRRAYSSWRHGWVRGYIATNRDSDIMPSVPQDQSIFLSAQVPITLLLNGRPKLAKYKSLCSAKGQDWVIPSERWWVRRCLMFRGFLNCLKRSRWESF